MHSRERYRLTLHVCDVFSLLHCHAEYCALRLQPSWVVVLDSIPTASLQINLTLDRDLAFSQLLRLAEVALRADRRVGLQADDIVRPIGSHK